MKQPAPLYDMASALETPKPWLDQHLPDLDPVARRHFVHLVTSIIEQQSLLIRAIAAASPFQAEPESNYTQVQRIIRDTRLTLETVYYPFLMQILAALPADHAFITLDQTNHGAEFNLLLVGWAMDAVSLTLGFVATPRAPTRLVSGAAHQPAMELASRSRHRRCLAAAPARPRRRLPLPRPCRTCPAARE